MVQWMGERRLQPSRETGTIGKDSPDGARASTGVESTIRKLPGGRPVPGSNCCRVERAAENLPQPEKRKQRVWPEEGWENWSGCRGDRSQGRKGEVPFARCQWGSGELCQCQRKEDRQVLSGPQYHAAPPPFPLMGLPADLLRHSHCHLLILPPTPICERTSANLNLFFAKFSAFWKIDPVADLDLDALLAGALPYILDISVHRLCIIVTYIFNSVLK